MIFDIMKIKFFSYLMNGRKGEKSLNEMDNTDYKFVLTIMMMKILYCNKSNVHIKRINQLM